MTRVSNIISPLKVTMGNIVINSTRFSAFSFTLKICEIWFNANSLKKWKFIKIRFFYLKLFLVRDFQLILIKETSLA